MANSLCLWRHLHYMLNLNVHHTSSLVKDFLRLKISISQKFLNMSSSTAEVSDLKQWLTTWCQGATPWQWSVWFLSSTEIACAHYCLPQSPHVRLVCILLTSPSHRSRGLVLLPFKYCSQIGLFAVYLNISIPKTTVTVVLCCCSLPCTFTEFFPHSITPEASSGDGGSTVESCWNDSSCSRACAL